MYTVFTNKTYRTGNLLCMAAIILSYQRHIVLTHHFSQVNERISHTSQGSVDAHARLPGNLLKAQVLIEAHQHNLALNLRQVIQHLAYLVTLLLLHNVALHTQLAQADVIQDLRREFLLRNDNLGINVTGTVNNQIVRYAYQPGTELARSLVLMAADSGNSPRKGLLEDVIGPVLLLNQEKDVGIYITLMTIQ